MTDQVNFLSTSELVGMSGLAERWPVPLPVHRCDLAATARHLRTVRSEGGVCWLPNRGYGRASGDLLDAVAGVAERRRCRLGGRW